MPLSISPEQTSWDNPFPAFPVAKKKNSVPEEEKIAQQMTAMELGGPPQNRPRTTGSKGSQDRPGGRGPTDDYGRPSMDSQRSMTRNYPQGPPQGRGPPGPAYGAPPPHQNGYAQSGYDRGGYGAAGPASPLRENFSPPARSMTVPNDMSAGRQPPMLMSGPLSDERPYNGPIGRGMPPRPSTATGTRPPPQRTYTNPDPAHPPQQYPPPDSHGEVYSHRPQQSISDFYDSYYDASDPALQLERSESNESEMPDFDALPVTSGTHKRGVSIDEHIHPGNFTPSGGSFEQQNGSQQQQLKPITSQPDIRAWAQPQAAVFEMAGDTASVQNEYPPQGYPDDGYAPQGQYNGEQPGSQRGPPPPQGYNEPPPSGQNGYPPRSASAVPRNGLPSGPKSGFNGLPDGPSPRNGAGPNDPPGQILSPDALPSHPAPVRAGLIPTPAAIQPNNKPPPVRNYNNVTPVQQQPAPIQPAAQATPTAQTPITLRELEQLRTATKVNPNDQSTQMLFVRKLVEASEVLVATIPDQRSRNKTREKYIMDAHKLLKKLVAAQNTEAMFYLADCYGRGALGLETDNKEAFSLYQSAAKAGHAAAAYRTAVCCELGNEDGGGTKKDPLRAIQWYKRAATLGDTPAMYKMGMIQLKGLLGQPKNPREAVGWLKRAAERADAENPHALHELGLLYELPQGGDGSIVRDEAYSFSLFQQAAELGYKFSQFRMGCAYEYGLFNCPIDPRQSIMWYSRAAVQEEHQSELALSGWYLTGSEGVLQQSDTEAYLWARKAAMAGLAKAEYAMGYFTEAGIGSPASLEDAKRWYWRAAGTSALLSGYACFFCTLAAIS